MTKLLQTFTDAVAVGSLYALIALGYTMVYGILQFINFAHSDIFMLGAWVSFLFARAMGWTGPDVDIPLWAGPFETELVHTFTLASSRVPPSGSV